MHVVARTALPPDQVRERLEALAEPGPDAGAELRLDPGRTPPKLFLSGIPAPFPAAAEVAIGGAPGAAEVVLRLMWGPLPAPFPRALAGVGLLAALLAFALAPRSGVGFAASLALAGLPALALVLQARGEKRLQATLGRALGGARFEPRPH